MGLDGGQKSDRAVKWIFKLEPWRKNGKLRPQVVKYGPNFVSEN